MNVCILGSNGFLGSYLVNNLKLKNIIPVDRYSHNITSHKKVKEFLKDNNIHTVINCAFHGNRENANMIYNLELFLNFYNNSDHFDHYINIGSGAEMHQHGPRGTEPEEKDILNFSDLYDDDYAFTKNVISRMCLEKENFSTLRLFGCFDRSEPDHRLFKKLINKEVYVLYNILFDYISAKDFTSIVKYYVENGIVLSDSVVRKPLYYKDINCVYTKKYFLSDIVDKFFKLNNIKKYQFKDCADTTCHPDYIGDGSKLSELPIELEGLEEGLKNYV